MRSEKWKWSEIWHKNTNQLHFQVCLACPDVYQAAHGKSKKSMKKYFVPPESFCMVYYSKEFSGSALKLSISLSISKLLDRESWTTIEACLH